MQDTQGSGHKAVRRQRLLVPGTEDTWSFQGTELWESRAVGARGRGRTFMTIDAR